MSSNSLAANTIFPPALARHVDPVCCVPAVDCVADGCLVSGCVRICRPYARRCCDDPAGVDVAGQGPLVRSVSSPPSSSRRCRPLARSDYRALEILGAGSGCQRGIMLTGAPVHVPACCCGDAV